MSCKCFVVVQSPSHVQVFCDPVDCSLPGLSVHRISQAKYWSGLPFPPPGDLPHPGIEPASPALQADSLPLSHLGSPHFFQYVSYHGLSKTYSSPELSFQSSADSFIFLAIELSFYLMNCSLGVSQGPREQHNRLTSASITPLAETI